MTTTQKNDTQLQDDVLSELRYEPGVKGNDIGVLVKDGAVTLNGYATSYGEKWEAVRATKRVSGVTAIADDIEVKLGSSLMVTDGEIALAAAHQIEWTTSIPKGTVTVTVRNGWVSLEGTVEWWYQKNDAANAVHHLSGVLGVSNQVLIEPRVSSSGVKAAIQSAFERSAILDSTAIEVETNGNRVTLRGSVRNYAEEEEASRAAWAAPGVMNVDNQIKVNWSMR